ncbi:MAG: hypothetical protein ACR2NM_06650, partial [Bythopirellula sp.]
MLCCQGTCLWSAASADALPARDSSVFEYRYEGQDPLMVRAGRLNLGGGYHGPLGGTTIVSDGEHA